MEGPQPIKRRQAPLSSRPLLSCRIMGHFCLISFFLPPQKKLVIQIFTLNLFIFKCSQLILFLNPLGVGKMTQVYWLLGLWITRPQLLFSRIKSEPLNVGYKALLGLHLEPHFSQLLSVVPSKIALKILLFLSIPSATPRFQAIITSPLDYYNSLLTGLSLFQISPCSKPFFKLIFINVTVWFTENFT